nr:unnamed protein product [Spirometra erinaceieuropaei]
MVAPPGEASAAPAPNLYCVGQNPGYLLCGTGGWLNAKTRAQSGHPPAAALIVGLLDTVLTPGSGVEEEEEEEERV